MTARNLLIDTSVWVNHFKQSNPTLIKVLEFDSALTHPFILGELSCSTPPDRTNTLNYLSVLRRVNQASLQETLDFIEHHSLFGKGCGFIDCSLLASTLITPGCHLWTEDTRLRELAKKLEVGFEPS